MGRKGELSSAGIDRGWPYQVALAANFVAGANYAVVEKAKERLGGCPRGHTVRRDDVSYVVYCFATAASADAFRELFNGERFESKDRGRGSKWWDWKKV